MQLSFDLVCQDIEVKSRHRNMLKCCNRLPYLKCYTKCYHMWFKRKHYANATDRLNWSWTLWMKRMERWMHVLDISSYSALLQICCTRYYKFRYSKQPSVLLLVKLIMYFVDSFCKFITLVVILKRKKYNWRLKTLVTNILFYTIVDFVRLLLTEMPLMTTYRQCLETVQSWRHHT